MCANIWYRTANGLYALFSSEATQLLVQSTSIYISSEFQLHTLTMQ